MSAHPASLGFRVDFRIALCGAAACIASACSRATSDARPNLLLVAIDTLRADRLGAYGYGHGTSPAIDELAERSAVFEAAYAQASWTLPSFGSLFTSLPTSSHGLWTYESSLPPACETLAELLAGAGYRTAGVASHVFFRGEYGLQQGFDSFDDELARRRGEPGFQRITSPEVTDRALSRMADLASDSRPWFLFVHYFDPHFAYQTHEGYERFGVEQEEDLYEGEIAFTDAHVARLLSTLRELEVEERTIVLLTSDHGEAFGEHGHRKHGHTLHREEVHVPLILYAPELVPARIAAPVSTLDVLPTILELLDVSAAEEAAGRSLLNLVRSGSDPERTPAWSELALFEGLHARSITDDDWRLLEDTSSGRTLLFERSDVEEREDLAAVYPDVAARLQAQLAELVRNATGIALQSAGTPLELSPAELEELRGLGYVSED